MRAAAHDRWVCFPCRWSAKFPLVDIRVTSRPSRRCPKCGLLMQWTGTAFRPPRRDDNEAWLVAEKLLATGFRFHSTHDRQRLPRKLAEVEPWLAERAAGEVWLPERPVTIATDSDGRAAVLIGRRALAHDEPILIWHENHWYPATIKLRGDAGRPLAAPLVMLGPRRSVRLSSLTRLRPAKRR